jgi:hypothetical protein
MTPLINSPGVILLFILSPFKVLMVTGIKLFEILPPFHGDKMRPRLKVEINSKTFSRLFDTGAAVTCMNARSFKISFPTNLPKPFKGPKNCVAT